MSRLSISLAFGFGFVVAAISANAAVSTYYPAERPACDPASLARAGALAHLQGQDAWVSARGDLSWSQAARHLDPPSPEKSAKRPRTAASAFRHCCNRLRCAAGWTSNR